MFASSQLRFIMLHCAAKVASSSLRCFVQLFLTSATLALRRDSIVCRDVSLFRSPVHRKT
jgi:hypothetical protein